MWEEEQRENTYPAARRHVRPPRQLRTSSHPLPHTSATVAARCGSTSPGAPRPPPRRPAWPPAPLPPPPPPAACAPFAAPRASPPRRAPPPTPPPLVPRTSASASASAASTASVAATAVAADAAAVGAPLPRRRTYGSPSTAGTAPIRYNMRHADPAAASAAARSTMSPPSSPPAGGGERQRRHGRRRQRQMCQTHPGAVAAGGPNAAAIAGWSPSGSSTDATTHSSTVTVCRGGAG